MLPRRSGLTCEPRPGIPMTGSPWDSAAPRSGLDGTDLDRNGAIPSGALDAVGVRRAVAGPGARGTKGAAKSVSVVRARRSTSTREPGAWTVWRSPDCDQPRATGRTPTLPVPRHRPGTLNELMSASILLVDRPSGQGCQQQRDTPPKRCPLARRAWLLRKRSCLLVARARARHHYREVRPANSLLVLRPQQLPPAAAAQRAAPQHLCEQMAESLVCPHRHVGLRLLADNKRLSIPPVRSRLPDRSPTRLLRADGTGLEEFGADEGPLPAAAARAA